MLCIILISLGAELGCLAADLWLSAGGISLVDWAIDLDTKGRGIFFWTSSVGLNSLQNNDHLLIDESLRDAMGNHRIAHLRHVKTKWSMRNCRLGFVQDYSKNNK